MNNILVFANQKGGVGKTFLSVAIGNVLATNDDGTESAAYKRKSERVLIVDCDAQGDATYFASRKTRDQFDAEKKTIVDAMLAEDAKPFIHKVSDTLSVLSASARIAILPTLLNKPDKLFALDRALQKVKDEYDWIIIDVQPGLSMMQLQALHVTLGGSCITNVVIPLQPRRFGADSIEKFADSLTAATETNDKLNVLAIVPSMVDARRKKELNVIAEARNLYAEEDGTSLVTESHIHMRSDLEMMVEQGFSEQKVRERRALSDVYKLVRELKVRVKNQ